MLPQIVFLIPMICSGRIQSTVDQFKFSAHKIFLFYICFNNKAIIVVVSWLCLELVTA